MIARFVLTGEAGRRILPRRRAAVYRSTAVHTARRVDSTERFLRRVGWAPLSQRTGAGSSASAPTAPTPFPTTTNTPATTSAGAALFPFPPQAERGVDDVGGLRELAEVRLEAWKGAPPSP